jgi:hypothetical protein
MPTHALPHVVPESVGVNDDCIDGNRLCSPVLPPGQVLPDESRFGPETPTTSAAISRRPRRCTERRWRSSRRSGPSRMWSGCRDYWTSWRANRD